MAALMNAEQYARHRGVSKKTAALWCRQGKIPATLIETAVGTAWQIDPVAADEALEHTRSTVRPEQLSAPPATPPSPRPAAAPAAAPTGRPISHPGANGPTLAEAQRARAVYAAERERLALLREKGELVLASEVKSAYFARAREIRDALLNLATRLAPILATVSDAAECHRLLTEEHAIALRSLADG